MLLLSTSLQGQREIDWVDLSDVEFVPEFIDSMQMSYLMPIFGNIPRELSGKEVALKGYFIPVNEDNEFYVLSKKPNASCYFCGAAGPETIVEIDLHKDQRKRIKMDDRIKVTGRFEINGVDLNHCNYILREVQLIDVE